MNHENTHDLFAVCDVLISDFSSIIFDYSLLNKPMCFFVPDLDEYIETLGCFVDYRGSCPEQSVIMKRKLLQPCKVIKNMILRHLEICFLNIKMVIIHKELLCLSIN